MQLWDIPSVQDEAAARIVALDTSSPHDLTQGLAAASWRRHPVPFSTVTDASTLQRHLLFSVSIERGDVRTGADNPEGQFVAVDATLVIAFMFRIRPGAQLLDQNGAAWAAHATMKAILAPWPGVARIPQGMWVPGPITNEWMPVSQRYQTSFPMSA